MSVTRLEKSKSSRTGVVEKEEEEKSKKGRNKPVSAYINQNQKKCSTGRVNSKIDGESNGMTEVILGGINVCRGTVRYVRRKECGRKTKETKK